MGQAGSKTDAPPYCPFLFRLLSMLYDGVVLVGLLLIATAVALPFGGHNLHALRDFWFTAWLILVCFAYFGTCWHYAGMTVGMRAWRLTLIAPDQHVVTWPMCLIRFGAALLSLGLFGLGLLWALVDRRNRTWYDLAAGTVLLRRPARARQQAA